MAFRKAKYSAVARVLVIVLLAFTISFIYLRTGYWTILLWLSPVLIVSVIELITWLDKTKRELASFLQSVEGNDFTIQYDLENLGSPDLEIKNTCNRLVSVYRTLQEEKEIHSKFLSAMVEHVDLAVVCFDEKWKVEFINNRLKKMFGRVHFFSIMDFERLDPAISDAVRKCEPGENILLRFFKMNQLFSLTVRSSDFRLFDRKYRIVSFQDIGKELDSQELDSWKRLIRTITHEVNNSVIPITNLADYTYKKIIDEKGALIDLTRLDSSESEDLVKSLDTIKERSMGLVRFVNSTRGFTKTIKPDITQFRVQDLFDSVSLLLKQNLEERKISTDFRADPQEITLNADRELIGQVIINLVLNSIDALENTLSPGIKILATYDKEKRCRIEVIDNGSGIDPENLRSVFVPYFSTREKGSGIGLSICRNIIDQHRGNIYAKSTPGVETRFVITL